MILIFNHAVSNTLAVTSKLYNIFMLVYLTFYYISEIQSEVFDVI